jgi:hypothetical protein
VLTFALGIVFYQNYINVPQEPDIEAEVNAFDEMEREKVFGTEMLKRKTIKQLKNLNTVSQFSLLAIVILNDGAIAIVYALFLIIMFIKFMVTSSETSAIKVRYN